MDRVQEEITPAGAGLHEQVTAEGGSSSTYEVGSEVTSDTPLVRVLGTASGAPYVDHNTYLKYNGGLQTSLVKRGNRDTSYKNIQYNVQARAADGNIPRHVAGIMMLEDVIRVNAALQNDIAYFSTKNFALPKTFPVMSLGGIIERLASGIAKFSMYGTLTAVELRGGIHVNVRSLSAATENIAVSPGAVFVTQRMCSTNKPALLCALFNAISGEDCTAYTDLLAIDGNGTTIVPVYNGLSLALGCVEALNILGRQYVDCGAGPQYALAVFRGINKIITLVGHSDEGGYIRHVLRRGRYEAPYGAVLLGDSVTYTGLPRPGGSVESFRKVVHSILIGGAAGVANCDPLVRLGDQYYPTVLSLAGDSDDPGIANAAPVTDAERDRMQMRWAAAAPEWAKNFTYYLGRLFAAPGSTTAAANCISACANDAIGTVDDHLRHRTAMAFCWVEPTSVTPFLDANLPAFAADVGALTTTGVVRTVPLLRDAAIERLIDGAHTSVIMRNAYLRRHGLFVHLTGHGQDGMAHVKLFSGQAQNFMNVGGNGAMDARILAGNALDTYQWGRLHNQVIAVGELMDVNARLRLVFEHMTTAVAAEPWNVEMTNLPAAYELVNGSVSYTAARPCAERAPGALVADQRNWSRSRTNASKSLERCRALSENDVSGWGAAIQPMLGDPICIATNVSVDDAIAAVIGEAVGAPVLVDDHVGAEPSHETSVNNARLPNGQGVAVPLVIHAVADRGPKAQRGNVQQNPGGNNPPPAGPAGAGPPPAPPAP
jgi:hypothetical protein